MQHYLQQLQREHTQNITLQKMVQDLKLPDQHNLKPFIINQVSQNIVLKDKTKKEIWHKFLQDLYLEQSKKTPNQIPLKKWLWAWIRKTIRHFKPTRKSKKETSSI